MAFTVKDWKDRPAALDPIAGETLEEWEARVATYVAANPSLVTIINAAAMEDLETRLSDYIDAQIAPLLPSPTSIAAVIDYWDADDLGVGGSTVSSWTGRNGKALVQATSGKQPLVSAAALNGHKTVLFDGADDYLSYTAGSPFVTTANVECYVVVKHTGGDSTSIVASLDTGTGSDWDTAGAAELVAYYSPGEHFFGYRVNISGAELPWAAARTTYGIVHSYWVGTTHTLHEGASSFSITNGAWGSFGANRLNIGALAGGTPNFFGGSLAAIVLANGLTAGERTTINNYLATRYGL
jgi:hypothetical protein